MRGYYEKQWQEALVGSSIQPSDALWSRIDKSLKNDGNNNRMWMTILLIAATVTLAFAFPLTIGNSSFEARPESYQYLVKNDFETVDQGVNIAKTRTNNNPQNNIEAIVTNSPKNDMGIKLNNSESSVENEHNFDALPGDQSNENFAINTIEFGLDDIDLSAAEPNYNLETYYFIPYYIPKHTVRESMLASINIGTGSTSSGGALNNFGTFESADLMAEPANNLSNTDNRSEVNGSTYNFGLGLELPTGDRWSLLAGIGYLTQTASGTSNVVLANGSSYQPVGANDPILSGTVFLGEAYDYTVKNSYINIPLSVKYSLINKKFKIRAGLGLSTDFMLSHKLNSESYGSASYDPSTMDFKPVVLAGLINLDFSYRLSNRYSVALETGVKKGLTYVDNSKEYYPSSFTVGLILFYKVQH